MVLKNYLLFQRIGQRTLAFLLSFSTLLACQDDGLYPAVNNVTFSQNLSAYNIYEGTISDLLPAPDYHHYKIGSTLFADYSEKQRLIKLPAGTQMTEQGDGLPDFPDGTIIVKTFYYYHDTRNVGLGKQIVETRLLIKEAGMWNVGTYLWDDTQADARLIEGGYNRIVNFINQKGEAQVIVYEVPSNRACASCHFVDNQLSPIGPKVRNLNIPIPIHGGFVDQIQTFQKKGLINQFDATNRASLPDYHDTSLPLEERARAYLDITCAHCHDERGTSPDLEMFYSYDLPFEETNIAQQKENIVSQLLEGSMPQIGSSVTDQEGAELIEAYIKSL